LAFQEFLAAERIARSRLSDRDGLRKLILEHAAKPEWHRTLLFLFAALWERAEPAQALDCFRPLLDFLSIEQLAHDPNPAYLLGDCLEMVHAKESRAPDLDGAYRDACLATLEAELSPESRARLFDALGRAGLDDRFGIGLDANDLPAFDWLAIPGGRVELENEGGTHAVESFHMARYPVTQTQFNVFVAAEDGFRNPAWWDQEWIEQGWVDPNAPPKPRWRVPSRPMESVSWHEAMAFCRWLSARLGYEVRLPTEMEWQQAATGGNPKNRYPWGGEYKSGYANIDETWVGTGPNFLESTNAVGIYPMGASPQRAMDMSGNDWEWCLNKYANPADLTPVDEDSRSRRGGSWPYNWDRARAAYRYGGPPNSRRGYLGFRLCCVSPIDEQ
jgi:formylglycine-generating enzyme required for sulfatase activity